MSNLTRRTYTNGCLCGKALFDEGTCVWCGHGNAQTTFETADLRRMRRIVGAPTATRPAQMDARVVPISKARRHAWSQDSVILAIRAFHRDTGRPPTTADWRFKGAGHPTSVTVHRLFGSWANAIEQAGFARPTRGTRYAQAA